VVGDTVTACPPLIITADEVDELFARLARALDRTLGWAKREQLLAG
jgi:4-aminobutyrate--pyruvate transaminase